MSIGLLLLVSTGDEKIYLSAQPEITFFKIAYKRYTNFSSEVVAQYFKNTPDFGRRVTVNISKNADLLGEIYLYVELPDIQLSNHSILPSGIKKFAWNKKIGLALINYVDLEIGGILLERQYADYLNIWFELTNNIGRRRGYNKMCGNVSNLYEFSDGKKSMKLDIPLNFWFCQDSGLALPLISMIHSEIKIHVEFNDFTSCYKESPTNYFKTNEPFCLFKKGELFRQNYNGSLAVGSFVYFDYNTQTLYYDKIKGDFQVPTINNDVKYTITGDITGYQCNIQSNTLVYDDESYFRFYTPSLKDAYLLVNFIYVENQERINLIKNTQEYLVPIVQNIPELVLSSVNSSYKIPFVNPNKIIFWRCQLKSNRDANDIFNYTMFPITEKEESIVDKQLIYLNSQPRVDLNLWQHYSVLQCYQNDFTTVDNNNGIFMYSFGIKPSEYQPSGSINFSEIDDSYLQFNLNKQINYQNPVYVRAYGLQYNVFKVSDGLGGLVYLL